MAMPLRNDEHANALFERGHEYHRASRIHGRFNGQRQGGISTPKNSPFIFIFTGELGDQYGYRDGWSADGTFSYTGEGQIGDMAFRAGNRAVLDHARNGRDLFLFEKTRRSGYYRFAGLFTCAGWKHQAAPDRNGQTRQAIIFKLLPLQQAEPNSLVGENAPLLVGAIQKPLEELRGSLPRWTVCPRGGCRRSKNLF